MTEEEAPLHPTTHVQTNTTETETAEEYEESEPVAFQNLEVQHTAKNLKEATSPRFKGDKTSTLHTVPMSPSQDYNRRNNMGQQQGYYYSQNSPATPLRQTNGFLRQTYPSIPPLSPSEGNGNRMIFDESSMVGGVMVPPASPLFPMTRLPNNSGVQYLTAQQLPNSPLISYGGMMIQGSPEHSSWIDSRTGQSHDIYTPAPSPYITPTLYPTDFNSRRTTSFDSGDFLPSPVLEEVQGFYATTSFAAQPWAYTAQNSAFLNPQSSLQPNVQIRSPPRMQGFRESSGDRGTGHEQNVPSYFPVAVSPGPPIQTANTNKGPDGANLFVFHIPNHFTNLDMYNLFCHYGNLLSVRIMVEKESGRSRGFGFVSYDNADSAALAIKNLNGFVVGSKRLKVQHKQMVKNSEAGCNSDMYGTVPTDGSSMNPSDASLNILPDTSREYLGTVEEEVVRPLDGVLNNFDELVEALPDVAA